MEIVMVDIVVSAIRSFKLFKSIWIVDSENSCQYFISDKFLFDRAMISVTMTIENGISIMVEKFGKFRSCVLKKI
jgi:hypothetical protein